MTTSFPSRELSCEVCRSSSARFCSHDCAYHHITCVPRISGDVNQTISASPSRRDTTTLQEFQFFQQDEATTWQLNDAGSGGLGQKQMASVSRAVQFPDHLRDYYNSPRQNLDVFSSSNGSQESPPGPSAEVSVGGQAGSSATLIPYSKSMATDAPTTGYGKEIGNASISSKFDPTVGREERVRRYKEKKKNRKFVKKIRYESRKVYADQRPRIKGRFVKRPESSEPTTPPPNNHPDLHGMGCFQP
ncbi:hypothetical protein AAC387_Pa08g0319 [Persea americana]